MRKGDWIETYTGKRFWPLDPKPEEICIKDIAHALSFLCRYNGHCSFFYTVAQHSLHCASLAKMAGWDERMQLLTLLHDAAEAYVSDIARPIKPFLANYNQIEHGIWSAILDTFGVAQPTGKEQKVIDQIDLTMLATEAELIMPCIDWESLPYLSTKQVKICERKPSEVELEFLIAFNTLILEVA